MTDPLPRPTSTTDVYLAAVIARLDALLALITPPPSAPPTPVPRRRPKQPAGEQQP